MAEQAFAERPFCADVSYAHAEPLAATASRVEHWLLIEYSGYWPHDPLDATVFAASLRAHVAAQLDRLPLSRLLLVRRPGRTRREHVRLVYGSTPERGARFHTLTLDRHPDLLGLDLAAALLGESEPIGEPLAHPFLLVCTHGKRDRCCARRGQVACKALHDRAPGDWVWQSTHVGGDRFAGNVVCLPEGLSFGRVGRREAGRVLARYIEGEIDLECYRGRSCYPFPVQAAECEIRARAGLTGFSDLRLESTTRIERDRWLVRFLAEVSGELHEVEVGVERGSEEYLTCSSPVPKRPRRFVARAYRTL